MPQASPLHRMLVRCWGLQFTHAHRLICHLPSCAQVQTHRPAPHQVCAAGATPCVEQEQGVVGWQAHLNRPMSERADLDTSLLRNFLYAVRSCKATVGQGADESAPLQCALAKPCTAWPSTRVQEFRCHDQGAACAAPPHARSSHQPAQHLSVSSPQSAAPTNHPSTGPPAHLQQLGRHDQGAACAQLPHRLDANGHDLWPRPAARWAANDVKRPDGVPTNRAATGSLGGGVRPPASTAGCTCAACHARAWAAAAIASWCEPRQWTASSA